MIKMPNETQCEYEKYPVMSIERPKAGLIQQELIEKYGDIQLQDLRQRIYTKAKTEPTWRFWGLYVHICKMETLQAAYEVAKENDEAPGIDGVTFEAIERMGKSKFLMQIREELVGRKYKPLRNRIKEIPKGNGKVRLLGIPTIRDRIVQGAMKLILEPIFEADFHDNSYGFRPRKKPQDAVHRVSHAIVTGKTNVIDIDLKSYFDNIRHDIVFEKVASRVNDRDVLHLLKLMLKAGGKRGVPQGGVISPLIANLYLNEMDGKFEDLRRKTCEGYYTEIEYVRFADDIVVLVSPFDRHMEILVEAQRLLEVELDKIRVEINREKSRIVDLKKGESFEYLGFQFWRIKSNRGKWTSYRKPRMKSRRNLTRKIKEICKENRSRPVEKLVSEINPVVRGWVNYFRDGNSSKTFGYIRLWIETKVRRHLMKARKRRGFGWKRWGNRLIYDILGLFDDYRIIRYGENLSSRYVT